MENSGSFGRSSSIASLKRAHSFDSLSSVSTIPDHDAPSVVLVLEKWKAKILHASKEGPRALGLRRATLLTLSIYDIAEGLQRSEWSKALAALTLGSSWVALRFFLDKKTSGGLLWGRRVQLRLQLCRGSSDDRDVLGTLSLADDDADERGLRRSVSVVIGPGAGSVGDTKGAIHKRSESAGLGGGRSNSGQNEGGGKGGAMSTMQTSTSAVSGEPTTPTSGGKMFKRLVSLFRPTANEEIEVSSKRQPGTMQRAQSNRAAPEGWEQPMGGRQVAAYSRSTTMPKKKSGAGKADLNQPSFSAGNERRLPYSGSDATSKSGELAPVQRSMSTKGRRTDLFLDTSMDRQEREWLEKTPDALSRLRISKTPSAVPIANSQSPLVGEVFDSSVRKAGKRAELSPGARKSITPTGRIYDDRSWGRKGPPVESGKRWEQEEAKQGFGTPVDVRRPQGMDWEDAGRTREAGSDQKRAAPSSFSRSPTTGWSKGESEERSFRGERADKGARGPKGEREGKSSGGKQAAGESDAKRFMRALTLPSTLEAENGRPKRNPVGERRGGDKASDFVGDGLPSSRTPRNNDEERSRRRRPRDDHSPKAHVDRDMAGDNGQERLDEYLGASLQAADYDSSMRPKEGEDEVAWVQRQLAWLQEREEQISRVMEKLGSRHGNGELGTLAAILREEGLVDRGADTSSVSSMPVARVKVKDREEEDISVRGGRKGSIGRQGGEWSFARRTDEGDEVNNEPKVHRMEEWRVRFKEDHEMKSDIEKSEGGGSGKSAPLLKSRSAEEENSRKGAIAAAMENVLLNSVRQGNTSDSDDLEGGRKVDLSSTNSGEKKSTSLSQGVGERGRQLQAEEDGDKKHELGEENIGELQPDDLRKDSASRGMWDDVHKPHPLQQMSHHRNAEDWYEETSDDSSLFTALPVFEGNGNRIETRNGKTSRKDMAQRRQRRLENETWPCARCSETTDQWLRRLLDKAWLGMVYVDLSDSTRILSCNIFFSQIVEMSEPSLETMPLVDLFADQDRLHLDKWLVELRGNKDLQKPFVGRMTTSSKSIVHVCLTSSSPLSPAQFNSAPVVVLVVQTVSADFCIQDMC